MGLMDSIIKGLKTAAESIDKQAWLSGSSSLGDLANSPRSPTGRST